MATFPKQRPQIAGAMKQAAHLHTVEHRQRLAVRIASGEAGLRGVAAIFDVAKGLSLAANDSSAQEGHKRRARAIGAEAAEAFLCARLGHGRWRATGALMEAGQRAGLSAKALETAALRICEARIGGYCADALRLREGRSEPELGWVAPPSTKRGASRGD